MGESRAVDQLKGPSLDDWAARLAADFFAAPVSGPVIYYVDDDYLGALPQPFSQESLVRAVGDSLEPPWENNIFRRLSARSHVWRLTKVAPPRVCPFSRLLCSRPPTWFATNSMQARISTTA